MDWSKAKNLLIVAFIITNVFLVFSAEKTMLDRGDLHFISDAYIENAQVYLEDAGLHLDIDLPREIISLPELMVKYKTFNARELIEEFLGEDYRDIGNNIFVSTGKSLEIISNKKFIYKNYMGQSKDGLNYPLDEDAVIKIADEFLKEHKLMEDGLKLQQIYFGVIEEFAKGPLYKLVYNQSYKDRFLGESYVNLYIKHEDVVGMEAMLLEFQKTSASKKKIIPATEALLRKMNQIIEDNKDEGDIVIKDMKIGYYFNPIDIDFTSWETIESGTTSPSWKIVLGNGKTYYVEALKN